jgi:HEAT repeat protein
LKLVKQVLLFFQEGSSDKVYEIDLCETSAHEYLVNFRYGRRGSALKEGTKTIFPVPLSEAEKVFDALEQEKRKKGYAAAGEVAIQEDFSPESPKKGEKRKKTILKILRAILNEEEHETWPVSRIIWRAGELNILEAEPLILKLADSSDPFTTYSSIWALARCGSAKSIPFLQQIKTDKIHPAHVQQLALDALLLLGDAALQSTLLEIEKGQLPTQLLSCLNERNYALLNANARDLLLKLKTSSNAYLVALYRLSYEDQNLASLLLDLLGELEPKPGTFKYLRQIFKIARMRDDFETYGVLAKLFESKQPGFKAGYGWTNSPNGYVEIGKEVVKENSSIAFSDKTKSYLNRKVLRDLRRNGEDKNEYTDLATGILLAFDDTKDRQEPYSKTISQYIPNANGRGGFFQNRTIHYDSYANRLAFNDILYKHSPRFELENEKWVCVGDYQPGQPAPKAREEAHPSLWDSAPENIIRLLAQSKAEKVHHFAIKVFKANPSFVNLVQIEHVIAFLVSPIGSTAELGYQMALEKYDRQHPQKALVIAMLESNNEQAFSMGKNWVSEQKTLFLQDAVFITTLLLSQKDHTRNWTREWLSLNPVENSIGEEVVSKLLAQFLAHPKTENEETYVQSIIDTLLVAFPTWVGRIHLDTLYAFVSHSNATMQWIGAKLLVKNQVSADEIPETLLLSLIRSENSLVRMAGLELIGQQSIEKLALKKNLLISLLMSPLADVRNNVHPLLSKIVQKDPAFAKELIELLVPTLLLPESYEGLHQDITSFFTRADMLPHLAYLSKTKVIALTRSRNKSAQELGFALLKQNIPAQELSVEELVKLSGNAQLSAREYAWELFQRFSDKIRREKEEALKMTDSYWVDTRLFAFRYFKEQFTTAEWTPGLFVSLCDSVKEDVQAFGREMITACFESIHGEYYLEHLSQHPDLRMQLFASNYLESFAADKPEVIERLSPFFQTLLTQINKGRTAKTRTMEFLRKESLKNEQVALLTSQLLNQVSGSISIQDKAKCIAILLELRQKYPHLPVLVTVKAIPDYVQQD